MQLHSTATRAARPPRRGDAPAQLHGRALIAVRAMLIAVAALALVIFFVTVPTRYAQLRTLAATGLGDRWTPAEARAALAEAGLPVAVYAASISALDIFFVSVFFAMAALLVWRKSNELMALFVAIFLVSFGVNWTTDPAWWTGTAWFTPMMILNLLAWSCFLGFFFLFPDGHFVPRWMRLLVIGWIAGNVLTNIFLPLPQALGFVLLLIALGFSLFAQIYRYRRVSGPLQRQQTKWVVFGFAVPFVLLLGLVFTSVLFPVLNQPGLPGLFYSISAHWVSDLLFLMIPLSLGIAILRYRLWDIDILINRTLVYAALTAAISGIYVLVIGGLGTLVQARGNPLIALLGAGLAAVVFQPLRGWLQRAVNRLMYGERDEPYTVLSRLGRQLETALVPARVLSTIVATVREALKLPYVAIALKQDDNFTIAATGGEPSGPTLALPLIYQNETVGQLILAPRAGEESLSPADRRLLDDLARQAGIAAHAVRLTADLQRSRERLVTAREEERRRLRRDLHDGLGPLLATQTLKLEAARDLIASDPARAAGLLTGLIAESQTALVDIRRLVYALRPPALDELGLIGAIREQAAQYQQTRGRDGAILRIIVDAPEHLPALPAAVEVAAYRIALEALHNVAKHAMARTCMISLGVSNGLHLDIRDDGRGLPPDHHAGVGLASMRERAAELGGQCTIGPAPGGGTAVVAWLPLL